MLRLVVPSHLVRFAVLVVPLSVGCAGRGLAQVQAPQEPLPRLQGYPHEHRGDAGLWTRPHLTGDWGGLRSWLRARGVTLDVFSTTDASQVLDGGVDRGFALRTLVDATAAFASAPLLGYAGGTLYVDVQWQGGDDGSADSGDLQRYSDIDHDYDFVEVAMLWYEQAFADDTWFVRVGKDDTNTSFQAVGAVDRFIHASFGHSPNLLAMPTYPDTACGGQVFWRPGDWYAGLGVYDGALQAGVRTGERGPRTLFGSPADLYTIGEAGVQWGGEGGGRAGLGSWHHTGTFDRFDGGSDSGSTGYYLLAEQGLGHVGAAAPHGALQVFVMYGFADADVSDFDHHVGAGLAWNGPSAARPDDVLGLGASYGHFSNAPGAAFTASAELAVEWFYAAQLAPWWSLTPVLTWIDEPGGSGVPDALVLTLRTALVF